MRFIITLFLLTLVFNSNAQDFNKRLSQYKDSIKKENIFNTVIKQDNKDNGQRIFVINMEKDSAALNDSITICNNLYAVVLQFMRNVVQEEFCSKIVVSFWNKGKLMYYCNCYPTTNFIYKRNCVFYFREKFNQAFP